MKTKLTHILFGLLVGVLFFLLFKILYAQRWEALSYTHAYFILPVSIWLVWRMRKDLNSLYAQTQSKFEIDQLIILALGFLIYLFGWRQDYMVIATFALIPFLLGYAGFVYGKKVQNKVLFPIFYLLFLVPPPFAILDRITNPLRYISAYGVEAIFKLFRFPITREGLMYVVKGKPMVVDGACSGFNSLITMLCLGVVYVYVMNHRLSKKLVMLASVVPLAIIGNIIRILCISLLDIYLGHEVAMGFMHNFSGIIIFLFIILGFVGIERIYK